MSHAEGWRLRITHETRFEYDAPARSSYNELRITPRTERRQTALEARVVTMPAAPQYNYVDYWGTNVVAFNVDRAHESLSIVGSALIDTQGPDEPAGATWRDVEEAAPAMADYLSHTQRNYTDPGPELTAIARELRTDDPLATAHAIMAKVGESLDYVRDVTTVHTSANDALAEGVGVCQDFAHLALAMCRVVGLPARYVSGYLHPEVRAIVGEEVTGESHAWVEVWTGSWFGYDPTNDCPAGARHVAIGRGRDYSDVPPVKGIYAGNAENTMQVAVRITRTA